MNSVTLHAVPHPVKAARPGGGTAGERVISMRAAAQAIAGAVSGSLADYLGIEGLKPFIDNDLILAETSDFHIPGTQLRGRGILAERFLEICNINVLTAPIISVKIFQASREMRVTSTA